MNKLATKGTIVNEFGEKVGAFWYREGQMTYTLRWHNITRNGWTLEGIQRWADNLGYYVKEG